MLPARSLAILGFIALALSASQATGALPPAPGSLWQAPSTGAGVPPAPRPPSAEALAVQEAPPDSVWVLADRFSAAYGLDDPAVLRALILAESGGDPAKVTHTAQEWSVGLLQLNRTGGRGAGYSEAALQDPQLNLALSLPEIAAAYRQARAEGYQGARLAVRVAALAQRPDPSTLERYATAYQSALWPQSAAPATTRRPSAATTLVH